MRAGKLLTLALLCWSVLHSATIYVDPAATGLNDGTSWANAYNNITNVDRSAGNVIAGDTVIFHGTTYTNTDALSLQEGTSGAWTTYKTSQEVGHNNKATFYCLFSVRHYTTLSGAKSVDCATNLNLLSTYDTYKITNYCNLFINRETNWNGVGSGGRSIVIQSAPATVEWLEIRGCTNRDDPPYDPESDSASEVYCYDLDNPDRGPTEIRYLWINQSSGHGAGAAVTIATDGVGWNRWNIHHCLIETNWSDVCNIGGGVDFHHNITRTRMGIGHAGCNDLFTISGGQNNIRIYNNLLEPTDNAMYLGPGSATNVHSLLLYNNVFTMTDPNNRGQTYQGGGFMEQGTAWTAPVVYFTSNLFFLNNTLCLSTNGGVDALMGWGTRSPETNDLKVVETGAFQFMNNLFYAPDITPNSPVFYPLGLWSGTNLTGQGWYYTSNTVVIDYNLFSSYLSDNLYCAKWGTNCLEPSIILSNAADIVTYTGYENNVSETFARLVSPTTQDYRPVGADVLMGTNLTSLTNLAPSINTDVYGITRPSSGPWSVGAIEYTDLTNGLRLWLTFSSDDGWTTNHVITDRSGWTNNAVYMASTNRETWPTIGTGPGQLSSAQFIVNWTNPYPVGYLYGTYAAITNVVGGGLATLTNGTWALWANLATNHLGGYDDIFLNAGQEESRWSFGNYYASGPSFDRPSSGGGQDPHDTYSRWPDLTVDSGWQHYAITWDGTNWVPYLNGLVYTDSTTWTNDNSPNFTNQWTGTLISTNSSGLAWNYIALGVNSHSGTPQADDVDGLPNNGQFWGQLADVRIYNRSLSAQEIQALYNFAGQAGDEEEPAITNRVYVTGTVRAGQVRLP